MSAVPGAWPSLITAEAVAEGRLRLADLCADRGDLYWTEMRPSEGGRSVIVRHRDGARDDVLAAPRSARTSVHEYGGGALHVHEGVVYFSEASDGGLYRIPPGGTPIPICVIKDVRFADFVFDAPRNRVITVIEDHRQAPDVTNAIAAIPVGGGDIEILVGGGDFYAAPRPSPDGTRLAWLTWNFPSMPWDTTLLCVADLDSHGRLGEARPVAGGNAESVLTPQWSPGGVLHFISDRTGWWNLYADDDGSPRALAPIEAESALPPWIFGERSYGFVSDGRTVLATGVGPMWGLRVIDGDGSVRLLDLPFTETGSRVIGWGDRIACDAGGPAMPASYVGVDIDDESMQILRQSGQRDVDVDSISVGEPISFPNDETGAHGILYRPRNPAVISTVPPPLIVRAHGGPTAQSSAALDTTIQFFTSRGFAFLDVDYRGSSGYGRAYRNALLGRNGVVDVADCLAGARFLAERGEVDAGAMFIRGGSAGGHIALLAACGHDVFRGVASQYGVADVRALAADTHKFESRYFDGLIGPLPEAADLYDQRSPLHRIGEISAPILLLQGLDDRVVPPSQTQAMYAALAERAIPVAALYFEGEAHGFRQAKNIALAMETELWWYRRLLGEHVEPPSPEIQTANL